MNLENLSRRQFLSQSAVAAGAMALATSASGQQVPATAPATSPAVAAAKRTASDIVELGKTGLKLSRLGLGLGSSNGSAQSSGGQERFNTFIKYAFDQGITFFDTANNYTTYRMMGPAIRGLPREKIFIQSKIEQPGNILTKIDAQRTQFNTDYIDSMLVHIQYRANWVETWKQSMEDYSTAIDRKWIKARGVSCHSLPALRASIANDWTQVHLVRVNHEGVRIDTEAETQDTRDQARNDIKPVVAELKKIGELKRGVIGMKVFGNGQFRTEEQRAASLRFVMAMPEVHSVVIGFTGIEQLDQGIKLMNKVLAEAA